MENFQRIHAREVSRGKPSRVKLVRFRVWSREEEWRDKCVDNENIRNLSLRSFFFLFFLITIIFKKERKKEKRK